MKYQSMMHVFARYLRIRSMYPDLVGDEEILRGKAHCVLK